MHEHDLTAGWLVANQIANVAIVAGYVLVPFTVLRYLPLAKNVLVAGAFFFITCAITHLSMIFHPVHSVGMVVNHLIQAVSVIWFVSGFFVLLRRADLLSRTSDDRPVIDPDSLT